MGPLSTKSHAVQGLKLLNPLTGNGKRFFAIALSRALQEVEQEEPSNFGIDTTVDDIILHYP